MERYILTNTNFKIDSPMYYGYTPAWTARRGNLYFATITSRKKYATVEDFKKDLTTELTDTAYSSQLYGYCEHAPTTSWHFHGFTHHKYQHFKKNAKFHIHVIPLHGMDAMQRVKDYCEKGTL